MKMKKQKQKKKQNSNPRNYGEKEVDFSAILPMPEGFEKIFLAIYFVTIPYAAGLLFLFIFVARGDFNSFFSLDIAMFFAVWCIGYEVVATLSLTVIFYKMFQFNRSLRAMEVTRTQTPGNKDLFQVHDLS